jgi:hypothetical protein
MISAAIRRAEPAEYAVTPEGPVPARVPPVDGRQPYAPPGLVVYGGVARITAKVGSRGMKDMSGSRRTGF